MTTRRAGVITVLTVVVASFAAALAWRPNSWRAGQGKKRNPGKDARHEGIKAMRHSVLLMPKIFNKLIYRDPVPQEVCARKKQFIQYVNKLPLQEYVLYKFCSYRTYTIREYFGKKHIAGNGIEIGAQTYPLKIDKKKASVIYVDRISPEENSGLQNLNVQDLTPVDVYADAENLEMFETGSLDFVISSHTLEHIPDPITALKEWIRVLKENGILWLALPNYRCNEYDFLRKPVEISHIIDDYNNKEKDNKEEHWKEFLEIVEGVSRNDPNYEKRLEEEYRSKDNRIHMHVFDKKLIDSILEYLRSNLDHNVQVIDSFHLKNATDMILILKKLPAHRKLSNYANEGSLVRNVRLALIGK
jgi:ubiquinone/menaquinone biosynthesis C-methylase UbiE